jgi:hypothetical protein
MSTYALRQELVRRNALGLREDDEVNYQLLLGKMVKVLVDEQEAKSQARAEELSVQHQREMERQKQERAHRKLGALARSRERQADPQYFAQRTKANVDLVKKNTTVTHTETEQQWQEVRTHNYTYIVCIYVGLYLHMYPGRPGERGQRRH